MDEQLRSIIRDLLQTGKARRGHQTTWELRKRDAAAFVSDGPLPQLYVKHPNGTYSEWPSPVSAAGDGI